MSPIDWAIRPLKKYADFSGRAPRAEFWWYMLALIVAMLIAFVIEDMLSLDKMVLTYGPVTLAFVAATFIPGLAVQVRRLHDTNRSGWWLAALWVPQVIYFYLAASMLTGLGAGGTPDMGTAGLVMVVGLVTLVVAILLIVWFATAGTKGGNKYGDDPYAGGAEIPRT